MTTIHIARSLLADEPTITADGEVYLTFAGASELSALALLVESAVRIAGRARAKDAG